MFLIDIEVGFDGVFYFMVGGCGIVFVLYWVIYMGDELVVVVEGVGLEDIVYFK